MITLEPVIACEDHIRTLHALIASRVHGISHATVPEHDEHEAFVRTHPYRYWYLVHENERCIGSTYIQFDNSIGINLTDFRSLDVIGRLIDRLLEEHEPLPARKSCRNARFSINVPSTDTIMASWLARLGHEVLQSTYLLSR